ncbi:MAG TPA: hypothetical protein VEA35_00500 [Ramlibacter sp.]|nr:hypothetical protein [Ramlibacter sp.]
MTGKVATVLGTVETAVPVSPQQRAHMQAHARALVADTRTEHDVRRDYLLYLCERQGVAVPTVAEFVQDGRDLNVFIAIDKGGMEVGRVRVPDHFFITRTED